MPFEIISDTGEFLTLSMGPHHPATHGVIRFLLRLDGEVISEVNPEIGYLHRGLEKIAEKVTFAGYMPYTDRIDYLAAICCNLTYAMAVEKALGVEVPRRAQFLRVIAVELNRIASHLIAAGALANDTGAFTPFLHCIREREKTNDLMEMLCGARLTHNYIRIGGVSQDLPQSFKERLLDFLDSFEPFIDEFNRLITFNEIFVSRLKKIGVISEELAKSYGLVGPNLRGSGVKWDLRKDEPYLVYPELNFDIPIGKTGDAYDRYSCRIEEMRQSAKILRQAIEMVPDGPIESKVPRNVKVPPNEVYVRTESARGDMGIYLVTDGGPRPYRLKIRTGSFNAMTIFSKLAPGLMIADLVVLIGSLDIIVPEIDR